MKLWCTFTNEQIDLDLRTETAKQYLRENFNHLALNGISIIRLDALGYVVKKTGYKLFYG